MVLDSCEITICFFLKRRFCLEKNTHRIKREWNLDLHWSLLWLPRKAVAKNVPNSTEPMFLTVRNISRPQRNSHSVISRSPAHMFRNEIKIYFSLKIVLVNIVCEIFFYFRKVHRSLLTWSLCSKMWGCVQCCYC